jgi:hypothetical protein
MEPRFYISPQIEDWIEGYLQQVCATKESYLFHGLTDPTSGQKPPSGEAASSD